MGTLIVAIVFISILVGFVAVGIVMNTKSPKQVVNSRLVKA